MYQNRQKGGNWQDLTLLVAGFSALLLNAKVSSDFWSGQNTLLPKSPQTKPDPRPSKPTEEIKLPRLNAKFL